MFKKMTVLLSVVLVAHGVAVAQPVGFAVARQGGPLYAAGSAIAKLAKRYEDLDLKIRSHQSTTQYMPLVDSGEMAFGLANAMELQFAYEGTKLYEGLRHENLRVVGAVFPTWSTLGLRASDSASVSGNIADVRGLRLAGVYDGAPIGRLLTDAYLANAGMTTNDVEIVPTSSFRDSVELFVSGRIDAVIVVIGSGFFADLEQRAGKLLLLSMNDEPQAVKAAQEHIPVAKIRRIEPAPRLTGVDRPIKVMSYNFLLFANADVANETVYKMARIIQDRRSELGQLAPIFQSPNPGVADKIDVPYHPGAIRFFKEKGVWSD